MLYTSGVFLEEGFADDFRIHQWCGSEPSVVVSSEAIQETRAVADTGSVLFDQLGISMEVQVLGSLSSIQIVYTTEDHPQATTAIQPGYWYINPNGATGYTIDLTLPHSGLSDPKVCKYTAGPGYGWDCYRDSMDSTTVTRNGITSFSDWAVGNNAGPTLVELQMFSVASSSKQVVAFLALGLVGSLGIIIFLRKR